MQLIVQSNDLQKAVFSGARWKDVNARVSNEITSKQNLNNNLRT